MRSTSFIPASRPGIGRPLRSDHVVPFGLTDQLADGGESASFSMPESWGGLPPPAFLRKVSETLEIGPDLEVWGESFFTASRFLVSAVRFSPGTAKSCKRAR